MTLAHATNSQLIGKNTMEAQDVGGKYFAKEMATRGQKEASFWFDYKFANPATKKIQVKDMYCEAVPADDRVRRRLSAIIDGLGQPPSFGEAARRPSED